MAKFHSPPPLCSWNTWGRPAAGGEVQGRGPPPPPAEPEGPSRGVGSSAQLPASSDHMSWPWQDAAESWRRSGSCLGGEESWGPPLCLQENLLPTPCSTRPGPALAPKRPPAPLGTCSSPGRASTYRCDGTGQPGTPGMVEESAPGVVCLAEGRLTCCSRALLGALPRPSLLSSGNTSQWPGFFRPPAEVRGPLALLVSRQAQGEAAGPALPQGSADKEGTPTRWV